MEELGFLKLWKYAEAFDPAKMTAVFRCHSEKREAKAPLAACQSHLEWMNESVFDYVSRPQPEDQPLNNAKAP